MCSISFDDSVESAIAVLFHFDFLKGIDRKRHISLKEASVLRDGWYKGMTADDVGTPIENYIDR